MLKKYMEFSVPYSPGRKVTFDIYKRYSSSGRYDINLAIFKLQKLSDCPRHENEWGSKGWKIFTLIKNYPKLKK